MGEWDFETLESRRMYHIINFTNKARLYDTDPISRKQLKIRLVILGLLKRSSAI